LGQTKKKDLDRQGVVVPEGFSPKNKKKTLNVIYFKIRNISILYVFQVKFF
jgi:hypothetical protein